MSDTEDPYAVSSDSEDEGKKKAPPPKINIGATTDLNQIKDSLTTEKGPIRDEKTLEEIEKLKRIKGEELSRMKKEFEQGIVVNPDAGPSVEVEKPTGLDKQTLSAFKDKFEKMDTTLEQNLEERLKTLDKSLEGVGKENLASMKDMFENQPNKEFTPEQKELLDLQRSDADKKRVLATFTQSAEKEEPKNCCICDKIAYPVEKVVASKKLYHTNCFKCSKCGKKLSPTTFNSHKGVLFCRPHMLEVLHPERAGTFGEEEEGDESIHVEDGDDDDEFAVSSKPKKLGADVVRAGASNIGDELSQLKSSLKEKKENWQSSVNETLQAEKRTDFGDEIEAGKVKSNLDKLISRGEGEAIDDEEKRKQLDAIREQVSEVKNKWKTGEVEKAEVRDSTNKEDLEELKKGPKVRERFSERLQPDEENVAKSYDRSELENSSAAEARKSFLEGNAFQSGLIEKSGVAELQDLKFAGLNAFKDRFEKGVVEDEESREKAAIDLEGIQLKDLKQAFEKGESELSPEERAEHKKQEIEAEFLRYKMARKLQAKKAQEQGEEEEPTVDDKDTDVCPAEVGSIKSRFEAGEAFKSHAGGEGKSGLDVDIKMAGKAREKFKNIEAQNPQGSLPIPKIQGEAKPSKWDKKTESSAEVVNKRVAQDGESDEEEAFDVKNLMNKFKNIENIAPSKVERKLDELEALKVEAKNLRQRFEQSNQGGDQEQNEEKKRQLEEEFKQLKEEKERARLQMEAEQEQEGEGSGAGEKEEIQVAADHASKMTAKWEKIHQKEAKKAQKSQMPTKAKDN